MYPEICKIGPFTIYSYGLSLAFAFLSCSFLARAQAKRKGINPDIIFNLVFLSFISGIIGARLFYIFQNLSFYLQDPLEVIMFAHGGLSWVGGLTSGVFTAVLYIKSKGMPIFKVMDLIAPFIALGQAIGRIGCLLNGCCFGKTAIFGIYFPAHHEVLIPTQLYSSFSLIFIFIILRFLQDRPHKQGQVFFTYLLLYSIKRFFIEFWRGDNQVVFLGLTLFQITSLLIFCVAIFSLFLIKKPSS